MPRYQFEKDLTHLEQVIPLLVRGNALGLPYWRRRITSLSMHQDLIPDGIKRVARLVRLFDQIEHKST
jgi:hypothetical protein